MWFFCHVNRTRRRRFFSIFIIHLVAHVPTPVQQITVFPNICMLGPSGLCLDLLFLRTEARAPERIPWTRRPLRRILGLGRVSGHLVYSWLISMVWLWDTRDSTWGPNHFYLLAAWILWAFGLSPGSSRYAYASCLTWVWVLNLMYLFITLQYDFLELYFFH